MKRVYRFLFLSRSSAGHFRIKNLCSYHIYVYTCVYVYIYIDTYSLTDGFRLEILKDRYVTLRTVIVATSITPVYAAVETNCTV